ncbi:3-deoxy-manno-octulosonate cytidylyltransferase [Thermanaerovibrio acidaminovorans]|uniref:3-deoxy-manno-octulosonate cytidylyltransferase n=1 Tax=Thermanaerovibrio acidaminovorans (strain ATCC 49978 / DSM 6589 / Su883) TaxID=525903 RepID=D1B673_THEAS|nr:3-deoxy-manno-octulosonate cytidylyltransferase [Thermanaerovibrio acidaminovorans]ACZ19514.1 3-deoxy-D-manno-octulosonatecytidylyltransferase [Thermanaerovibrio acidaminovorans DSM 6589]
MAGVLAVIPARYGSTRLRAKALMRIGGRTLVERVLAGVVGSPVDRVIVATDHEEIARVVRSAGGEAWMTPPELPSGTDRVAYVARQLPEYHLVLNVQGDDPLVGPDMIGSLVEALEGDPSCQLAVLAKRIEREEEVSSPSVVKMVFDLNMRALYFSRSPIPYPRNRNDRWYKHIGPYAYRRSLLMEFASWEVTPLERVESLEMLRVLEMGRSIKCVITERDTIEIDTEEDVRALEEYLRDRGELD